MEHSRPFEKDERICFIGSSTTANSYWVAAIAEYYATHRKEKPVTIIPCGIAGGGCTSAITYYQQNVAVHSPTTIVIMLGMNDIHRWLYEGEATDDKRTAQKKAIERFETNLFALSEQAKVISRVKRIIYLTSNPYDEEQVCTTPCAKGCWNALLSCADIMKKAANEFGGEYYENGIKFYNLLKEVRNLGSNEEFIGSDRVHPNLLGMSVMARLFLSAQGFEDMNITARQVIDGEAVINLSDAANRYNEIAKKIQRRWTSEWIIARESSDGSAKGRIEHCRDYAKNNPDAALMFINMANEYEELITSEQDDIEALYMAIKELYI